ncbi:transposase [Streptomyces sp. NPDC048506]|uniref:transposase n=1 Tax=Streptomyces sp. NPDC048506 TaxID=3155028 RepID=UPI0034429C64
MWRSRLVSRGDLADEQWAVLEPLLPRGKRSGRPPTWTRQLIDGMRFRVRTGIPWRDMPDAAPEASGPSAHPVPAPSRCSRLAAARGRDAPWGGSGEYPSRWGARGEKQLHNPART